jgi:hypothetical protein
MDTGFGSLPDLCVLGLSAQLNSMMLGLATRRTRVFGVSVQLNPMMMGLIVRQTHKCLGSACS